MLVPHPHPHLTSLVKTVILLEKRKQYSITVSLILVALEWKTKQLPTIRTIQKYNAQWKNHKNSGKFDISKTH